MNTRLSLAAGVLVSLLAASARAGVYEWDWQVGDPGDYSINNTGGVFESIHASYDNASEHFTWSVTFSNRVTDGFTLAVNDGPNPKNSPGQLALLYVDASDMDDVRLTAYGYNGKNNGSSWYDGDGSAWGHQTPDLIRTYKDDDWIIDADASDQGGKRTISFTIDATAINAHTPAYPDPDGEAWKGVQFDDALGLWMHPSQKFNPKYYSSGKIKYLDPRCDGWFDGKNFETVPTPGAALLAGLGMTTMLRRRRPR